MSFFDLPLTELHQYRPEVPEPPDLDEFWASTLAEARSHDLPVTTHAVETDLSLVEVSDVTFPGHGGTPVRGWYTRPAGVERPLPAVVEYLGYGRGRGLPGERLTWPVAGYAHLLMDTRGQGGVHGSGGDTRDPVGSGPAGPGFMTRGIEDPADYYYTRLITDAVRAVDAVRRLPGVDAGSVSVTGGSQGGGLAVAVAGLVPDLRATMPNQPLLCHVRRAVGLTGDDPYQEVVRYLSTHREAQDRVFRTLSYVDGAALARRARASALFSVGLQDTICPPSTVFAAYNAYGRHHDADDGVADRQIEVYPYNHHEGGEAHQVRAQLRWLAARA